VMLGAAPDVESVQLEFVYDPTKLKLASIQRGQMLGEQATLEADITTSPGRALVRIDSAHQPLSGDGELFKVRFEIDENAPQFGHLLSLENIKAYRFARSQGDGPSEQAEVRLTGYAGELRVIDKPVSIWILGPIAGIVLVVTVTSFRSHRSRVRAKPSTIASPEPVAVAA
jgi:hypothetical protein